MDFKEQTAVSIGQMIKNKEISCVEVTQLMLQTAARVEPEINAFSAVTGDIALQQAQAVQKRIDSGEALSSIAGVPMGLKDNICTQGVITSCGSRILSNFQPPYNATVTERLQQAGAILLGKLNMDEFAMGGSTETSFYGATKNPWDVDRVPGGSSGGAAAAVASGEVMFALGSDTGGSIRQPCSFCGLSGIKPTYGAVSRFGLVAYASSLDQIGPMAHTIEDCAAVLTAISGHDAKDSTSISRDPFDFSASFHGNVKGLKIGIPHSYYDDGLDPDVRKSVLEAAKVLEAQGAVIEEFDLPLVDYAIPAYYIIACAEASSNLSRYDGIKYGIRSSNADSLSEIYHASRSEGFGPEVKRRIMLGSFVLSSGYYDAYYKKALQVRGLIQQSFREAFEKYDMILSPNAPTTAYKIGENISDPIKMYLGDIYTVSVNLAGIPAATIPCGFDRSGMPIGLQLMGRPFEEPVLVQAAHAYQSQTGYHLKRAPIFQGGDLQ